MGLSPTQAEPGWGTRHISDGGFGYPAAALLTAGQTPNLVSCKVPSMSDPEITEVCRMADEVLITFSDGMVARLNASALHVFAVDPSTLPQFFKDEGDA
jgi:hypothetical protein